jgi:thiamine biosynthesis lipoprotein
MSGRSFRLTLPLLLSACFLALAGREGVAKTSSAFPIRIVHAMGTYLRIEGAQSESTEAALGAVSEAEFRLSTWRQDSELAHLNRAPIGRPQPLSAALARELGLARQCSALTGGAFHPGLGALIRAWGLRSGLRHPSFSERSAAWAASRQASFRFEGPSAPRLSAGYEWAEGGFAKGLALDAAADAIRQQGIRGANHGTFGGVLLDFGGQILAQVAPHAAPVEVGISDPSNRTRPVALFRMEKSGSISTSGDSEKGGHLLDPFTGEGARDFGSATVIASGTGADGFWADCLSTGLFVMGPEKALAWQKEHPSYEIVMIEKSADQTTRWHARASCGLRGLLRPVVSDISIEFNCHNTRKD